MNTSDVTGLLRSLMAHDPGRPRLTWYAGAGERVELSAKVLDNWVAKTANFLVDSLDAGPGTRVALDLPLHWRTAVWLLAAWSVGASVVPAGGSSDVLVTHRPTDAAGEAADVVAVALPALAASFGPGLPDGVVDGAVEVRAHGDVFVPIVRPAQQDEALPGLTFADLLAGPTEASPQRLLVTSTSVADPVAQAPRWLLQPLRAMGSLVLADAAALSAGDLDRVAAQEGVTAR